MMIVIIVCQDANKMRASLKRIQYPVHRAVAAGLRLTTGLSS